MSPSIADIRAEYSKHTLNISDVQADPIKQFQLWFDEANKVEISEVNAMHLSTVNSSGMPSSRIMLLKGIENNGFVFFTNYQSDKGKDLDANPAAALLFFWKELERQVRIQGHIEKINKKDSEQYFQSRPKGSQIGAWTSPQSTVIESRELLEEREKAIAEKYKDAEVLPKPEQWGGYILKPMRIEFWQGRPNRLHDRILYSQVDGHWKINRLAP
ncbi:MAG: pyridoxamine 5'-phosphate oxidase [Bacteroidota bacterium]